MNTHLISHSSVQEEANPMGFAVAAETPELGGHASSCCGAKYYAKGMCKNHYNRNWYRTRELLMRAFVNWETIFQKVWSEVNRNG